MTNFVEVDVRPTLRAGGEPFGEIMAAVSGLAPGQGLRLYATFKPTPLLHVLGSKGFVHEAREIEGGDWEVLFTPNGVAEEATEAPLTSDDGQWPNPVRHLDNRDLDPPEPMVRILAAVETMRPERYSPPCSAASRCFCFHSSRNAGTHGAAASNPMAQHTKCWCGPDDGRSHDRFWPRRTGPPHRGCAAAG